MPSMNLVNYLAFKIPSKELHVELFNEVQIKSQQTSINGIENWLISKGLAKSNRSTINNAYFLNNDGTVSNRSAEESGPIWIRNKIHHPDLNDRRQFSEADLVDSINELLDLM